MVDMVVDWAAGAGFTGGGMVDTKFTGGAAADTGFTDGTVVNHLVGRMIGGFRNRAKNLNWGVGSEVKDDWFSGSLDVTTQSRDFNGFGSISMSLEGC